MKAWVIARPINGIGLNGDEYAVDDNGKYLAYETESEARQAMAKLFLASTISSLEIHVKEIEVDEDERADI